MKITRISRRTALPGLGVSVALPFLDAMLPRSRGARRCLPRRMAFVYAPNGKHMPDWTPKSEGADFDLPPTLEPLRAVRGDVLVLSGLAQHKADSNGDGPGDHARRDGHVSDRTTSPQDRRGRPPRRRFRSINSLLPTSAEPRVSDRWRSAVRAAVTGRLRPRLQLAYQTNLSWRTESRRPRKKIDPRLVFERLFGDRLATGGDAARDRRDRERKSVLDFAAGDARHLATDSAPPIAASSTNTSTACATWNGELNGHSLRSRSVRPRWSGQPASLRTSASTPACWPTCSCWRFGPT